MVSAGAGAEAAASMENGSGEGQQVGLIYDRKVSSIGPADVTGSDLIWEPQSLDLAMKLHYLRGVYYFEKEAFEGLTTLVIKEPMFIWLNKYPMTCGRFRRSGTGGRPFIKCNDCGVRFLEAKSHKTLDEWLEMKKNGHQLEIENIEKLLVPSQVVGPELGFSPLVFVQLTKYKCGGTALGISWAHVLGDAFSLAEFMNSLGRAEAGYDLGQPENLTQTNTKITADEPTTVVENEESEDDPLSIKKVGPVGDHWVNATKLEMEVFSFTLTATKLGHLQAKLGSIGSSLTPFATVSAVIWQCIARIRGKESEPKAVTICTKNDHLGNEAYGGLGNKQKVSVVKAEFTIVEADPGKLASMVQDNAMEENGKIDAVMERGQGLADVIIYGSNLTFVDLEGSRFYEFEYRGQKPVDVSCRIDGVGEQGAILVLPPNPKNGGRNVMAILPQMEVVELKKELQREGLIS